MKPQLTSVTKLSASCLYCCEMGWSGSDTTRGLCHNPVSIEIDSAHNTHRHPRKRTSPFPQPQQGHDAAERTLLPGSRTCSRVWVYNWCLFGRRMHDEQWGGGAGTPTPSSTEWVVLRPMLTFKVRHVLHQGERRYFEVVEHVNTLYDVNVAGRATVPWVRPVRAGTSTCTCAT